MKKIRGEREILALRVHNSPRTSRPLCEREYCMARGFWANTTTFGLNSVCTMRRGIPIPRPIFTIEEFP